MSGGSSSGGLVGGIHRFSGAFSTRLDRFPDFLVGLHLMGALVVNSSSCWLGSSVADSLGERFPGSLRAFHTLLGGHWLLWGILSEMHVDLFDFNVLFSFFFIFCTRTPNMAE